MGIISGAKRLINPVGRARKWTGSDTYVSFGTSVLEMVRGLFFIRKDKGTQEFEDTVKTLGLEEATLERRARDFLRLARLGIVATLAIWSYMIYLLIEHSWHGAIVSLGVSCVVMALTFRYHFWYFQVKQRRLGCTFSEWWNQGILGRSAHE